MSFVMAIGVSLGTLSLFGAGVHRTRCFLQSMTMLRFSIQLTLQLGSMGPNLSVLSRLYRAETDYRCSDTSQDRWHTRDSPREIGSRSVFRFQCRDLSN